MREFARLYYSRKWHGLLNYVTVSVTEGSCITIRQSQNSDKEVLIANCDLSGGEFGITVNYV